MLRQITPLRRSSLSTHKTQRANDSGQKSQDKDDKHDRFNRRLGKNVSYFRFQQQNLLIVVFFSVALFSFVYFRHQDHKRRIANFPSVEERVELYMSLWSLPHCTNQNAASSLYQKSYKRSTIINNNVTASYTILQMIHSELHAVANFPAYANIFEPILLEKNVLEDCKLTEKQIQTSKALQSNLLVGQRSNMITYCIDGAKLYNEMATMDKLHLRQHRNKNGNDDFNNVETPILSQWGDKLPNENIGSYFPLLVKWRPRLKKSKISQAISGKTCWPRMQKRVLKGEHTVAPIIWNFGSARHLWPVRDVWKYDVQWRYKKPMAVWRGTFTGVGNSDSTMTSHAHTMMSPIELCRSNQRCNFVYQYTSHPLIDIGFDSTLGYMNSTLFENGKLISLIKPRLMMSQLVKYKMLISLEGNDVASGLKWSLYSNSIVMMPPPTKTSFAMEELLEPWTHFVPLAVDGSDLAQKVQWVLDHDDEAQYIAQRGKKWIWDLLYHPQAERENQQIQTEILKRYRELLQD